MVYLKKTSNFLVPPNPENKEKIRTEYVFIRQNNLYIKLLYNNLVFVQSAGNYVELQTCTSKKFVLKSSIVQIQHSLNYEKLIRIHRSYLINIDHINEFSLQEVTMSNGCILPIGKNYQDDFLELLFNISISA
ncbi:LytR/AlgR family response regulator transcription factor [Flectobacillus rivi]|uniref:LytTR family DNA-binding domain-containing protein n=1 Tax=Flectobacillus rivi TaxID=2984209 RepID=A0ABT6YW93_9BACT|nr:LytTR family DNA-binding domain-containing protein [Flectobacillus rivi]MDI9873139.1 LytTR family DNA-binding domain-containing protein [Flectobacillus rivi]